MDLLSNELIRKYFDPGEGCTPHLFEAYLIQGMTKAIKMGEKYLYSDNFGKTWEESNWTEMPENYHPLVLRLPDKFQPAAQGKWPNGDKVLEMSEMASFRFHGFDMKTLDEIILFAQSNGWRYKPPAPAPKCICERGRKSGCMWICPVHDQPPAAKSGEAGKCDGWPHSLECGNQNHYMCDYQTCKCTLHEFNRKPAEDAVDLHLERILHEIQKELILKKPDTDIWNYGGFKEMLKELVSLARASRSRGL